MDIEKKIVDTIKKYKLMKKSDKVVVALSGGKDSTSVIYILKKLGYDRLPFRKRFSGIKTYFAII